MSKKTALAILLSVTGLFSAKAQYFYYDDNYYDRDLVWEMGISLGKMYGLTDVGNKKGIPPFNLDFKSKQGSFGTYISALYRQTIGVRLEANWGDIDGTDSHGDNPHRNLSYKTSIQEFSLLCELHFLMLTKKSDYAPRLSPYFAAGVTMFDFNPQALYQNKWVDLRPLRLEGQGFSEYPNRGMYHSPQAAIPFGFGLRFEISQFLHARIEGIYRYTFTDYLDDVSQAEYVDPALFTTYLSPANAVLAAALFDRTPEIDPNYVAGSGTRGNPNVKDGYIGFNLKLGVTLGRRRR